jgi:hypothetical protein
MAASNRDFPAITSMIHRDHAHVLAMFRRYMTGMSSTRGRAIVNDAVRALEINLQLEEEIFYPALQEIPGTDEQLDRGIEMHAHMRRLIRRLRTSEPGSVEYERAFCLLVDNVMRLVDDEEASLLPAAEEWLVEDLVRLGLRMAKRRQQLLDPHVIPFPLHSART